MTLETKFWKKNSARKTETNRQEIKYARSKIVRNKPADLKMLKKKNFFLSQYTSDSFS